MSVCLRDALCLCRVAAFTDLCSVCVSMAKHYNMRLVMKQRFSEFFQEKVKKEQHRSLMMKMMALEVKLLINNQ